MVNFLAHLYLAPATSFAWAGSILGDFVRRGELHRLAPEERQAVELHWAVDAFTDSHPVVQRSRRRLAPPYRRYAPVLLDLFYDHFLAAGWSGWSSEPLQRFTGRVYAGLRDRAPDHPAIAGMIEAMVSRDWLCSYADEAGIALALTRMERRLRRPFPLGEGAAELGRLKSELRSDFEEFFPELQREVARAMTGCAPTRAAAGVRE